MSKQIPVKFDFPISKTTKRGTYHVADLNIEATVTVRYYDPRFVPYAENDYNARIDRILYNGQDVRMLLDALAVSFVDIVEAAEAVAKDKFELTPKTVRI